MKLPPVVIISLTDSAHPLRLNPESSSEREGYLEIFQNGGFAKICDDDWYPENTVVASVVLPLQLQLPRPLRVFLTV